MSSGFDWLTRFFGNTPIEIVTNGVLILFTVYIAYRFLLEPLLRIISGIWTFWRSQKRPLALLEITPPEQAEVSPHATQQLFTVLRQIVGKHDVASLEIVSSRSEGIRYILGIQKADMPTLQRHIASYLPEVRFKQIPQHSQSSSSAYQRVFDVKQSRHYAYPLQQHEDLSQSDPIAYITGAMTKLEPHESITAQIILSPHESYWTRRLSTKLLSGRQVILDGKLRYFLVSRWWVWAVVILVGAFTSSVQFTASIALVLLVVSLFIKEDESELSPAEQQLYEGILNKLNQPLFRADIRLQVAADTDERLRDLSLGAQSSLAPLNVPGFQQLYTPNLYPDWLGQKTGAFKLQHRLPSLFATTSNVLAASELASVYHFPYGTIKTEGLSRSHSRTLPAPLSLKNNSFDFVLGQNNHHGEVTEIGLTTAERERHVYIIGGTGNGKTTMLQYALVQDIQNGKGVAVVDPHGDMAETLLGYVPEERINDVIYFNPDDLEYPIGLNLLELTPGLTGDELLREKDLVTESVVSMFRKIFSEDDSGGHRIEYVLRNAVQTALTVEDATLFTVYNLLNDPKYCKKVVATLDNEDLVNFWKNELGKAGGYQQVKMVAGITAKIGRFLFSASAKRILEQPKSTIDFDEILDGKILICNFSKGLLGEDTSELFGIAVLAKLQLASLRRARIKQADRKPFYLYVDEFQNFATPSFVQLLSEARKYKLFLTMAEQSTSQQDDQQMVNIILANVGTVICFRTGNPADEKVLLPLFKPYIDEGEIAKLPSYNFYMRISAVKSQEPFSGETLLLKRSTVTEDTKKKIIGAARNIQGPKSTLAKAYKRKPHKRSSLPGD